MFFRRRLDTDDSAIVTALNASQAVIAFTPDGYILQANDNFLKTVGYTASEIIGKHHRLFCDPLEVRAAAYGQFWKALAEGQFASGVFRRFGKDGEPIWLQATYNPVFDTNGRVIKVIKFASDITYARLKEIDFKGKIDAVDRAQAVIEFTPNGTILTANANFLAVTGYSLSEIAGRHHSLFCDADYAASRAYRAFWEALGRGEYQSAEYRRVGKSGQEIYIQATYNPVYDDQGVLVKVVKFATDITAAVHKRHRSEQLNAALGQVVEDISAANTLTGRAVDASQDTGGIINSVAAASEEMSLSVKEITESMGYAREGVQGVFQHAEAATVSAVRLNESALAMSSVVNLIQNIAAQINLLALNATIESARAGEAGRGFAVVAVEVKNLANQAAQGVKTIADEIARMQNVSTEVTGALGLISGGMNTVLESVASVAGALEQQNAATSNISSDMQSAVGAMARIDTALSAIAETFDGVAQASEEVKRQMDQLAA